MTPKSDHGSIILATAILDCAFGQVPSAVQNTESVTVSLVLLQNDTKIRHP